ncbi:shikimate 5-dehydrogenase [Amnibacterium sp. CER49]|uniref:shikimate 5-dehydrogenase n=1 Tax=Amnibacterium sp. CER49 TaxID=3039161 RepID=UPI00244A772F|nr:shikimate 5-dehydrogenase [Amnibacterium sp. CER49]MDH2442763.1 shikimate 5-dehydrogenase [Amnibacterium sp. CER49]
MPTLSKDTLLCISLAGRPSNLGTRFHNFLYDELGLDFVYKAFTTTDLEGAVRGVRALGIRGCSVSMPFKSAIIPFVDIVEDSAAAIEAVNTVVNDDGVLTAANTDVEAVTELLDRERVPRDLRVAVRGSGSMAAAVTAAFRRAGFEAVTIVARDAAAGRTLADRTGYRWVAEPEPADLLVNVTPLGMAGRDADALAFDESLVRAARMLFDVVALPVETPLVRLARSAGLPVLTGAEVHALQAALQFERYTGIRLTRDQIDRASAFSRA